MKKLLIVCTVMLVVLSAGQAFALPGVYKAGAATMTLNLIGRRCETRTISLDGTGFGTSPLVSGGFLLQNDNEWAVDITSCQCYDGTLTPAIWDAGVTPVFDPYGFPAGLFVAMAKLGEGLTPSDNILVCDVTFCGVGYGTSYIDIGAVYGFDFWVAQDFTVYDSTIDAAIINVTVTSWQCECFVSGPFEVQANITGDPVVVAYIGISYTGIPSRDCDNPSVYVYSDDCVHGTIDPNTGVLTVPAFSTPPEESCTITVTDTANTDHNTGDPMVCTKEIVILAGTCECEGNFDNDEDVDGFDAATFKVDFGRGGFTRPCINSDLCNGDFNCDGDVDGTDAALFKQDYGRSVLINPCPSCPRDPWCVYP